MNIPKKIIGVTLLFAIAIQISSCTSKPIKKSANDIKLEQTLLVPNEPLFTNIFFADPSAHVFDNKLYIYPSHDIDSGIQPNNNGDQYAMEDYHVLTIYGFNSPCLDNGQSLHIKDVPWAKRQMWAPDAAYKNGTYYFYFPAKDNDDIFRIGVATASTPTGPFKAQENYIPGSYSMDPAVFTDSDNNTYMYFGGLWGGQLEKWQTGKYDTTQTAPEGSQKALGPKVALLSDDMLTFKDEPQEISILDENGNPLTAMDEHKRFFEGAWVHKYKDNYYLSYSTGTTHYIVYAMSNNPKGPFTYKGRILNPVKGWTTHHSIVQFKDKWYLFYHDASVSGVDHKRSLKYTELQYNEDGTIVTVD